MFPHYMYLYKEIKGNFPSDFQLISGYFDFVLFTALLLLFLSCSQLNIVEIKLS